MATPAKSPERKSVRLWQLPSLSKDVSLPLSPCSFISDSAFVCLFVVCFDVASASLAQHHVLPHSGRESDEIPFGTDEKSEVGEREVDGERESEREKRGLPVRPRPT